MSHTLEVAEHPFDLPEEQFVLSYLQRFPAVIVIYLQ